MRNFANNISAISSASIAPDRTRNNVYSPQSLSDEMTLTSGGWASKRFASVTMSTIIKAPVEACFNLVARQFKEAPRWDPTVRWVVPISDNNIRVGSKSRFIIDLAGSMEESEVVLRSIIPNKLIAWTSDHRNQLQEEWHFRREADGSTMVTVTLRYNPLRGLIKYLIRRTRMHIQVERAVSEMLRRLKMSAELPKPRYL